MPKEKKKKIALLINAFWNAGAGISGGDQRVIQIFKRIARDFEVDIYTSKDGKNVISREIKSADFIISPEKLERGNILLRYHRRANWLSKELTEKKYDLIYSSSDFFPDVLPAYKYKRRYSKTKWIACIFHIYPNWLKRPGNKLVNLIGSEIQSFSFDRIKKLADQIVNINYQVRDELIKKYHIDRKKIIINPCGIDLEYFTKIKATKNPLQVCFLARLAYSKGIFDMVPIWREVIKKVPKAKLLIIGGGSDKIKQKLKDSLIEAKISDSVEILGFLDNDRAYKILKSSKLFLFPSHEEGFGISIAEAFACGVPVVAWDLPVYQEVFPHSITTAEIGDYKSMARNIIDIFHSDNRSKKLLQQGRNVIQKYSWEGVARKELRIMNLEL
jgi:glycosyltransferase involved in cell wall biosynthesis